MRVPARLLTSATRAGLRRVQRARRASAGGFTLVELMVVVVLISVLSLLAFPVMRVGREDRLAFDWARRIQQLSQRARARAAGRGAAQLFVATPGVNADGALRGRFLLFEALDGSAAAAPTFGPNPTSSCRGVGQWTDAAAFVPGAVSTTAPIVDGFDMSTVNPNEWNAFADIRTTFSINGAGANTVVMCVTPGGATYVGQGAGIAAAVLDMQAQTISFSSFVQIRVTRQQHGATAVNAPAGLARDVIIPGGGGSRISSRAP